MGHKITKRLVESLAEGSVVMDTLVIGFGCRVQRRGRPRYFVRYRYRGRNRFVTIGAHGVWSPETARARARELLGQLAGGTDPAALRDAGGKIPTLGQFSKQYLQDWSEVRKRLVSIENDRRYLRAYILRSPLGAQRLDTITRADVTRFHLNLRRIPFQANRAVGMIAHMLTMARKWGILAENHVNPCRDVDRFPERKRERAVTDEEIVRLGAAFERYGDVHPFHVAAIKLLMFTGARPKEIRTLRWEAVDLAAGVARLREHKTDGTLGVRVVRLSPWGVDLLRGLPRVAGNPFVFPGEGPRRTSLVEAPPPAPITDLNHVWVRLRASAGLDDVRLYDLRHSYASVAGNRGYSLPQIGGLLGHTQAQTTQRYVHLAADPLRTAAEDVAGHIAAQLEKGQQPGPGGPAKVVPIRGRRGPG